MSGEIQTVGSERVRVREKAFVAVVGALNLIRRWKLSSGGVWWGGGPDRVTSTCTKTKCTDVQIHIYK